MQVHGHRTRRKHVIEKRGESSLRTRRTHRPTRSRQETSRVTEPAPPATSLRARSPSEAGHLQRRGLCLTHTPLRGQDGRRADPRAAKPLGTAQAGRSRVSTARQGPAVGNRQGRALGAQGPGASSPTSPAGPHSRCPVACPGPRRALPRRDSHRVIPGCECCSLGCCHQPGHPSVGDPS